MYELINDESPGTLLITAENEDLDISDMIYGDAKKRMIEEGILLSHFTTKMGTGFYINYCKTCDRIYTTINKEENGNGCCCVRLF